MRKIYNIKTKVSIIRQALKAYAYDAVRYFMHSTETDLLKFSKDRLRSFIITRYHIIEKGLTMRDMRLGFGKDVIKSLIYSCNIYLDKFGKEDLHLITAVLIMKEYLEEHIGMKYQLDDEVLTGINEIVSRMAVHDKRLNYLHVVRDDFFKNAASEFPAFSKSRHSIRNFLNENIPVEIIEQAIELAQYAPTSCNRQPIRLRVISERKMMSEIFKIQTGNRGFSDRVNTLIVISAEISVYNEIRERNLMYIDSGLYTMNLLYSLHYFKVGACVLNWSATVDNDKKLRYILRIPESEVIVLLIACGQPADKFKVTHSVRTNWREIVEIY